MEYSPQKLTEIEENVLNFVENIPIYNENYIFNYLLEFINYNIKDTHSGAKCKRAIECLIYIIDKSDGNCLILKQDKQTFLLDIINKLKGLFDNMKNIQIKEYLKINNNKNNTMFNELIKQISKFFLSVINKNEINSDDLIIKIIEFYDYISNQIINELKIINEISFIKELKDLYNKVLQSVIVSLSKELAPIIYAYIYEKDEILTNIENKLLKIIQEGCYKINEISKDNIDKIINESINNTFIINLFSICKYQSNEEILEQISKSKLKNIDEKNFLAKYKNLKKKCISLLITKLNEILKEYKNDYEKKKEEIKFILNEIKNLEIFPEFIEKNNDDESKDFINNKKIHILYLYQNIIELLPIENKDIQLLIKDIMRQAFDIFQNNIQKLPIIFQEEK